MCGPLALALPAVGNTRASFLLGRMAYNLGRVTTYCLLGVIFGLIGRTLLLAGIQRWLSIGLGIILLAGLFSSNRWALWVPTTALVHRLKTGMSFFLRSRSFLGLGLLGLLNGFLPCGLVYVACAGATASGGVVQGVQYMALFGLGTIPMLMAIGISGRLVPTSVRLLLRKAVPVSVFLVGTLLILRGMSLGIPYLSPDLSVGGTSCCHR